MSLSFSFYHNQVLQRDDKPSGKLYFLFKREGSFTESFPNVVTLILPRSGRDKSSLYYTR